MDTNNLYGYALAQCLPQGNFKWIAADNILNLNNEGRKKGYLFDVTLDYPKELHDSHNGFV